MTTFNKIKNLTEESKNLKLLYVEDDQFARESTLETLSLFFDNITIAVNGQEGLNTFKKYDFDIIITDINMPIMNGIDMIFAIRELNQDITILVLSAYNNPEYFESTIKAGIEGYLLKPIDLDQFIYLIDKSVNNINRAKELEDYKCHLEERVEAQTTIIKENLYRDSLTGLYNFLKLEEDIDLAFYKTLIVFDITQLSLILKQYGRIFTSKLLSQVAITLSKHLSSDMQLYKLEADKFAVLSSSTNHEHIKNFCEQALAYYDISCLEIEGIEIQINFSIGISQINKNSDSTVDAEYALGNAKKIGSRYYFFYDIDDHSILEEKEIIKWLNVTKELIRDDQIFPYYQAILDIESKQIVKYEVLARAHYKEKILAPIFFLDAAEKLGMTSSISKIIIQKSFQFFSQNNYAFSINIAQRDLLEGYLVNFFTQKLELYNIDASRVTLEILENVTVSIDNRSIQKELSALKNMGFSIAIDDFGIENSNFSRLVDINLDIIKIDGFFIKNIVNSEKDQLVVKSIVSLAKTLGVKVVAEYVENQDILDIITEIGIDFAQGYHIGKPSPTLLTL
jgi:EAL domain-containing protein (putative c-di-GMP-specific phosphodiesterase class I)/PleD family two-component response regulator